MGAVHQVSRIYCPADLREPARSRQTDHPPRAGTGDITRPYIQKFFDRLASSNVFVNPAVDSDLRLIEYGEVGWSEVKASTSYKFHPEFLHPIHSVMEESDFLLLPHQTGGDLIIMSKAGMLATCRNRKWKIDHVPDVQATACVSSAAIMWGRTSSRSCSI